MPGKKANRKKYWFALDISSLDTVPSQFPLTETMSMRIEGTQYIQGSKSAEIILLRQIMILSSRPS